MSAAAEVAKVANKCREAQADKQLDLSDCNLKAIPDAVYIFFRETSPEICNLSLNVLKIIPAKFPSNFNNLKELNLSSNLLTRLPNELSKMVALTSLDISENRFIDFPDVVYSLSCLKTFNAKANMITDIDTQRIQEIPNLHDVYLNDNPLSEETCLAIEVLNGRLTVHIGQRK